MTGNESGAVEDVVHRWYDHARAGRKAELAAMMADEFKLARLGKTPVSGIFHGPDAERLALLEPGGPASASSFADYRIVIVDGELVVALASSVASGEAAPAYDQRWLHIFRVRGGRVVELVEFLDTVELEHALYANAPVTPRPRLANPFTIHSGVDPALTATRDQCVAVIEGLRSALTRNEFAQYVAHHRDDFIVNFVGNALLSGRSQGAAQYFDNEIDAVIGQLNPTHVSFAKNMRIVAAGNSCACVLLSGGGPTVAGDFYDQQYVMIWRIAGDKVAEVHQFFDTVEVERALYRNPMIKKSGYSTGRSFEVDEIIV